MKIRVEVCWVVASFSLVVGYQSFGEPSRFHLQSEVTGDGKTTGKDIGLESNRVAEPASQ